MAIPKRGLVLEGGGAKGAWQYGALKALKERGLSIDVVAGTSVGALNGLLWALDRFDVGENLWGGLHLSSIFRFRRQQMLFAPFGIGARLFAAYINGLMPEDVPKRLIRAFALFAASPWILWVIYGVRWLWIHRHWYEVAVLMQFGLFMSMFLFKQWSGNSGRHGRYFLFHFFFPVLLVPMGMLVDGMALLHSTWFWLSIVPYLTFFAAAWHESRNDSLFSPAPLRKTITTLLDSRAAFKCALYATIARKSGYYDPDHVEYEPSGDWSYNVYIPKPRSVVSPEYVRIDQSSRTDAVECLMGTSALPLGIVERPNNGAIDGGAADNCPWFPIVSDFQCDELIVIGCNPIDWNNAEKQREWQRRDRLQRVIATGFEPVGALSHMADMEPINDPPRVVPLREPLWWPSRIVLIAPGKPLGTFLTGTLNFDGTNAARWMAAGYSEAMRALAGHAMESRKATGM